MAHYYHTNSTERGGKTMLSNLMKLALIEYGDAMPDKDVEEEDEASSSGIIKRAGATPSLLSFFHR
jgi:hypothetical protein